jgi:hypothetical protein
VPPGHVALRPRHGAESARPLCQSRHLKRGARLSALLSRRDSVAVALPLQSGPILVAPTRPSLRGADRREAVNGLNRPNFRAIVDFRKRDLGALSDLFVQVMRLCRAAGLVQLAHVAVEGTKAKVNASRHNAIATGG